MTAAGTRRLRRRDAGLVGVWLLALASVVSWRQGVLYAGGADPVVIAKATVAGVALLCALVLRRTAPTRRVLSPFPMLLVGAVVGISLVGAVQAGTASTNLVLVARIALLTATVLMIMSSATTTEAITSMLVATAVIGVVAAATSFVPATLAGATPDRLGGGIPPLEPNELATIVLPAAIGLTAVVVRRGIRLLPSSGLLLLTLIIFETGSRAALGMLVLGAVVLVLRERRLAFGVSILTLIGVVAGYVVIMFSSAVADLALRGQGVDRLLTFNSRTISWGAVLDTPKDQWAWWIGNGLSMKSIAVLGQYWKTQVFDSSWISSIAQDGIVGTVVLAVLVGGTLVASLGRRSVDPVVTAVVVTVFVRSFFENGLVESSVTYAVFLTAALAVWPGTRALRPRTPVPAAIAGGPRPVVLPVWERPPVVGR